MSARQGAGGKAAGIPAQQVLKVRPAKARSGIGLAAGGDVLVACDVGDGVALCKIGAQVGQGVVLGGLERGALQPFELDADRIVIALAASAGSFAAGSAMLRIGLLISA